MSIKRNTFWNITGAVVPLFIALITVPYLLHQLGAESFGVLTLVWALIGYFSFFDFGIGRALTYELAKLDFNNKYELAPYLQIGIMLTFVTGVVGAVVVCILAKPLSSSWLSIQPPLQHDAYLAFLMAALGVIPTTLFSGLRGALEGLNRFAASNVIKMLLGSLMFVLPAWAIFVHGNSLWIATIYMVGARVVFTLVSIFQLRNLIFLAVKLSRKQLMSLLNYGVWVTLTGIVGPIMVYGDRFFVSAAVGAQLLPQYAIPQEALQRLLILPTALCSALLPYLSSLKLQEMNIAYSRNSKRIAFWMFCICLFVALVAYPSLSLWISPNFAASALPITLILVVGIWFNSMAMVPYTVIHALGDPRTTATLHLVELFLYIFAVWLLSEHLGLVGAALAWTARTVIDFTFLRVIAMKLLSASKNYE